MVFLVGLLGMFWFNTTALAAPTVLSYQGRIVKSDGRPLEYESVSFLFQITNPTGTCVLYEEQVNGFNMLGSGGVFDAPIGNGTRLFPTSGSATILDTFNNVALSLPCKGGATFNPTLHDARRLRVQFHDGQGWKQITPDNTIRTVPYASFSLQAAQLGSYAPEHFVIKSSLPNCSANTFLSWNGTVLSCEPVSGSAGGTVTDVASTNAYLSVANGTSNASLTLNVGTTANTVAAGNDSRFSDSRPPNGAASGALTGSYPNPTLANNAVTTASITDGAVTVAKLAAGSASGQVLRYSGAAWQATKLNYADLINANGVSPWPGTCGTGEFITWVSVSDGFACSAFNASAITTALGYTPANAARTLTAGTGLTGGGDLTANRTFAVDVGTGANQIPQLDGSGKLNSSVLPSSVSNGLWSGDGTNVYRTSGNVGIGTSAPGNPLHVVATGNSPVNFDRVDTNNSYLPGLLIRRMRSDTTAPGAGFGTYSTYALEGFTDNSYPLAAAIGSIWELPQTNDTADRDSALLFETMLDNSKSEKMRLTSTGNVGIGTTTPATKLHVHGATGLGALATLSNTDVTGITYMNFIGTGAAYGVGVGNDSEVGLGVANKFLIYDHATGPRVVIDSSGNVGIGTTTPTTKLEVAGTVKATAFEGPLSATTSTTGAGSNSAPSMSFTGDPNTGFYNASSNDTISVATGGVQIFDFSSTGLASPTSGGALITTAAGTASAPTFSFAGDPDTGWFSPAANTLAAATAGAERIRIDSAGNVGIGVTNPGSALEVNGTITAKTADPLLVFYDTTNAKSSDNMTGGFLVRDSGNSIAGGVRFGSGDGFLDMAVGTSAGTTSGLLFQTDGANRMRILGTGEVGIGTTSPTYRLNVVGSTFSGSSIMVERYENTGSGPAVDFHSARGAQGVPSSQTLTGQELSQINFYGTDENGNKAVGASASIRAIAEENTSTTAHGGGIAFRTTAAGTTSLAEKVRISNSGNVGIGTTSPLMTLHVRGGTSGLPASSGTAQEGVFRVNPGSTNATLDMGVSNAAPVGAWIQATNTSNLSNNYNLLLNPNGGNVGIGTTAPQGKMHVELSDTTPGVIVSSSGAANSRLSLANGTSSAGSFLPALVGRSVGSNMYTGIYGQADATEDTGTTPLMIFSSRLETPSVVATRPLVQFRNHTTPVMTLMPSGHIGIGTALPDGRLDVENSTQGLPATTGATDSAIALRVGGAPAGTAVALDMGVKGGTGDTWIQARNNADNSVNYKLLLNPNGGNVGIGTISPVAKLQVATSANSSSSFSDGGLELQRNEASDAPTGGYIDLKKSSAEDYRVRMAFVEGIDSGNGGLAIATSPDGTAGAGVTRVAVARGGNVGIGTISPSSRLHVTQTTAGVVGTFANSAGTCTLTPSSSAANWACSSDERLKTAIQNISGEEALNRMLGLHAVTYTLKKGDDGRRHTGYIAQNVRAVASEFVTEGADGILQVSYTGFIPWITEGLKYLHLKVLALIETDQLQTQRISSLEKKLQEKDSELQQKTREIENLNERLSKIESLLEKNPNR